MERVFCSFEGMRVTWSGQSVNDKTGAVRHVIHAVAEGRSVEPIIFGGREEILRSVTVGQLVSFEGVVRVYGERLYADVLRVFNGNGTGKVVVGAGKSPVDEKVKI